MGVGSKVGKGHTLNRLSTSNRACALALTLLLAILFAGTSVSATAFKFGVMADTQWSGSDPTGRNVNTVAVNQINACNQAFINAGVDFVVQVGDLGDNGSLASLQTRLDCNAALNTAGIAFYGLRGNHEDNSAGQTFFQNNYIPTSTASAVVARSTDNTSYSVTYKNTKLVLLDILTADSPSALTSATSWMSDQLSAADHTQAFVFSHKNLLGQNHKDNLFGSSNDANPTQQNAFLKALNDNGVRYEISGHDHIHHRSLVASPDGLSKVQEIICASDSYKYYTPGTPYSSRETPIAQQMNKTGYYIYTIDGPKVNVDYYSSTPLSNGDVNPAAPFTLQESFGYSLNGQEFLVARGASYSTVQDSFEGTVARILGGSNGSTANTYDGRATTKTVDTGWTSRVEGNASSTLTLWGMANNMGSTVTDTYALSMSCDPTLLSGTGTLGLVTKDAAGNWVRAVDVNAGGTKSFIAGAYDSSYGLGTYGYDASTNTAWAVVNHNGDFAVSIVPEPSAIVALSIGCVGLLARRRRA